MSDKMTDESNNMAANGDDAPTNSAMKWVKRGLIGAVVLVALVGGAIFFYAIVLNDAPDALDESDLSEALADPEPSPDAAPATDADPDTTPDATQPAVTDAEPEPAPTPDSFDGVWLPTTASEFGYRVDEVLGGVNVTAVGRSNEIEGALTIDGNTATISATVQIANITSDQSRRDGQFSGPIMDAANFPTAVFTTTAPIDFGEIPADGGQVTATASGELTLRGVTRAVEVEVTAQLNGNKIGVLGNIPVIFADYGIDDPSNPAVKTEDHGLVEFILVFEQS
jgi:polyisoprenoid-binding protein YceI